MVMEINLMADIIESTQILRQHDEENMKSDATETVKNLSLDESNRLLHELQVHQIELELQNEELHRTQAELDAESARYLDLYDLAQKGYCTLNKKGLILQTNLTATNLLGMARSALIKQPITRFIINEDHEILYLNCQRLLENGETQDFELRMVKMDGTVFWAHLTATAGQDTDKSPTFRVVISDIDNRKRIETFREIGREILQILNEPSNIVDSIRQVLEVLKMKTGFDALGIRLHDGEDFPYYAQKGFTEDFL